MKIIFSMVIGLTVSILFQFPLYAQDLMSVDIRSQKNKVEATSNSPIAVHIEASSFKFEGESVSYEDLSKKIDSIFDTRTPDDRAIHLTADSAIAFTRVADVLKIGRKFFEDNFFINGVPIKIVLDEPEGKEPKPGPRFLRVSGTATSALDLNGKIHSETSLVVSLKNTFDGRTRRKVYIYGSKDIDKTVFIKVKRSTKYEELVRILQIVHSSGAYPICVEIDWLKD